MAGCGPSGVSPRRIARRASTPSRGPAGSSSRSRRKAGHGCRAASSVCWATRECLAVRPAVGGAWHGTPAENGGAMSWLVRLVNVFRAERVSDEIDRELAFHLAERADELRAAGASPDAARREARRRFGSVAL